MELKTTTKNFPNINFMTIESSHSKETEGSGKYIHPQLVPNVITYNWPVIFQIFSRQNRLLQTREGFWRGPSYLFSNVRGFLLEPYNA